jgi:hypothetical protein
MSQPEQAGLLRTGHPTPSHAQPLTATEQSQERLRSALMRQSLSHLLNGAAGARSALPHLSALEAALGEHGTQVLAGMSRLVLAKLCSQLARLPVAADDAPLLDLQERLMQALETAPSPDLPKERPVQLHGLSDFLTDEKLLVAEASYADFAAAAAGFATTQRTGL